MRTLAIAALVLSASWTSAAEREYFALDTHPVDPDARIVVTTDDVEIHVRGTTSGEVRASTDLRIAGVGADRADAWLTGRMPKVETTPDRLTITSAPEGEGFLGLGSFLQRRRLGLEIPFGCTPDLTTGSAPINLRGAFDDAEPMRLRSGSGAITITGTAHSFEIRSTSGNSTLDLARPAESLWARTSAGNILLNGGARSVQVETASGRVELHDLVGSATVETVDGAIALSWDVLPDDARVKVVSSRGDVRIRIPFDATPSGRLSTSTGFIRSEFPGTVNDAGDAVELAGDGPHFEVETASGDVVFEKDPGWFAPERQATPSTEAEATGPE
jgi:hypothetical protein